MLELLKRECQKLKDDELLMSDKITLQDTIYTVEIMNSRMDAGMAHFQKQHPVPKDLTPGLVLGLMDGLITNWIDWIGGQCIALNIFSCRFLDDYEQHQSRSLVQFIRMLMFCIHGAYDIIVEAEICFEEDFMPDFMNCNVKVDREHDTAMAECLHTYKYFQELVQSKDLARLQAYDGCVSGDIEQFEAIGYRLEFVNALSFLLAVMQAADLKQIVSQIQTVKSILSKIQQTHHLAAEVGDYFDLTINYHKFPQIPPSPNKPPTFDSEHERFLEQLDYIETATALVQKDPLDAISLLQSHARRYPDALILSRSFLHLIVSGRDAFMMQIHSLDFVQQLLQSFAPIGPKYAHLLHLCHQPIMKIFQVLCYNRARQRRRLFHLIHDLEFAERMIEESETELVGNDFLHLTAVIYHLKLTLIIYCYKLGHELELYSDHELPSILYYQHYLLDVSLCHLNAMEEAGLAASLEAMQNVSKRVAITRLRVACDKMMTRAFLELVLLLQKHHKLKELRSTVFNPEAHYTNRFKPLQVLATPAYMPRTYLVEKTTQAEKASEEDQLKLVIECFTVAKDSITKLLKQYADDDLKQMLKVCISNLVHLGKDEWKQSQIKLDFSVHHSYPIIKPT
ncbi:hypothetical protein EDD86DRAFT_205910 [Gorgonomyces haynaldii]|nr:hypothetical protein EDD86DRAFT_205910 [Gorgonomyces haynaldii]